MLQKICRSCGGPFFVGVSLRPNMLNMPKSAAVENMFYVDCLSSVMFSVLLYVDISGNRLQFATQIGADYILTVEQAKEPRASADAIVRLTGWQPDVTIECSGAESSVQTAVYVKFCLFFF